MEQKDQHPSCVLCFLVLLALSSGALSAAERGTLSIHFMDEKVGYEEYAWDSSKDGYALSVRGMLSKPTPLEIEKLLIHLDKSFIPTHFEFKGSIAGVEQQISCSLKEGNVEGVVRVSGHEHRLSTYVRRDAFLLPNAVFSPYMILTKKLRCSLQEKVEFSAYVIPQMEAPLLCAPVEESSCLITVQLNSVVIDIQTDESGELISLVVPSQNLRILKAD
jgi:hypothetical protein